MITQRLEWGFGRLTMLLWRLLRIISMIFQNDNMGTGPSSTVTLCQTHWTSLHSLSLSIGTCRNINDAIWCSSEYSTSSRRTLHLQIKRTCTAALRIPLSGASNLIWAELRSHTHTSWSDRDANAAGERGAVLPCHEISRFRCRIRFWCATAMVLHRNTLRRVDCAI